MSMSSTRTALRKVRHSFSALMIALATASGCSTVPHSDSIKPSAGNTDAGLLIAMRKANQGYTDSVIEPTLKQFVASATQLKGVSEAFESAPTSGTLSLFRAQLADTEQWRTVASTFDFGPIHSQGYAALMDTRLDTGGLMELVRDTDQGGNLVDSAVMHPWLQGFEAMHYLLNGPDGDKPIQAFTDNERLYLQKLATSLQGTTENLLISWTTEADGYPAYKNVLATAGTQENRSYQTVHAASEEILRGVINSLDVVVNESYPSLMDNSIPMDAEEYAAVLGNTHAVLQGALSSFSGRPTNLESQIGQSEKPLSHGIGFSHWVGQYDDDMNMAIHEQLVASIAKVEQLVATPYHENIAVRSATLESAHESMTTLLDTMQNDVLPLTQSALATN